MWKSLQNSTAAKPTKNTSPLPGNFSTKPIPPKNSLLPKDSTTIFMKKGNTINRRIVFRNCLLFRLFIITYPFVNITICHYIKICINNQQNKSITLKIKPLTGRMHCICPVFLQKFLKNKYFTQRCNNL